MAWPSFLEQLVNLGLISKINHDVRNDGLEHSMESYSGWPTVYLPKGSGFAHIIKQSPHLLTSLVSHLPSQRPYTNLGMPNGPCVVQWSPEARLHSYLVKCHA